MEEFYSLLFDNYYHKRKEAHKIIRNKKKTYMKNVIESIEEDQKHNNTRKMYQTVNQFKKGYQHKFSIIRNKKGELAMNIKEKAEIWKEYFDKLLNTEEPRELIKKGNKEIGEVVVEVEQLTTEDVKKAIRSLKNNKAAGTDGIHLELILRCIIPVVCQINQTTRYLCISSNTTIN